MRTEEEAAEEKRGEEAHCSVGSGMRRMWIFQVAGKSAPGSAA